VREPFVELTLVTRLPQLPFFDRRRFDPPTFAPFRRFGDEAGHELDRVIAVGARQRAEATQYFVVQRLHVA
jgi:hypothetical protein